MSATEKGGMDATALTAVIERAQEGDAEAFAELYRGFSRRVAGLCGHMLGSREEAEDAASEVFLRAQRGMRTYDIAVPFQSWLLRIAANYCVDVLRRRRVEACLFPPYEAELPEAAGAGPSPLAVLLAVEERDTVRAAVAELADHYRLPLTLRYYSELSYDEIGATLGLTRNHVATLIFRAKTELRRTLGGRSMERAQ